jgi:lipopolysaccharide transport system ATP-binding protein
MLRIGMTGTFDLANFGDLLFPLVARHELERRLGPVEIRPFSYHARSAPSWPFDVAPLDQLAKELPSLDLLLVGGGDIIRFDPLVAPNYYPTSPRVHHPTGFWLGPIFLAHAASVPVVWNAPGVPRPIPAWARALVRASVAVSAYVSLRDAASRELLTSVVPDSRVEVVPDTAFNAAVLLTENRTAGALPLPTDTDGYVVVQSRPEFHRCLPRPSCLAADADRRADIRPCTYIVTPVGPAMGDLVRAPRELPSRTIFCPPLDPYQMLALIARSSGVIGRSLHLTIAALSLGRPALRPKTAALLKYRMLEGLKGVHDFDVSASEIPDGWPSAPAPDPSQLAGIRERLARHWDTIASLARATSGLSRPHRSWTPLLMDLWERLPATLEQRSTVERVRAMMQTVRDRRAQYRYNRRRG